MTWTAPVTRATGYIVLASDWNNEHVGDLLHLHGDAGPVVFANNIGVGAAAGSVGGAQGSLLGSGVLILSNTAGSIVEAISVPGDSQYRQLVFGSGQISWGPGNAPTDVSLSRSGAGQLTVTTTLTAGQLISTGGLTAGTVSALGGQSQLYGLWLTEGHYSGGVTTVTPDTTIGGTYQRYVFTTTGTATIAAPATTPGTFMTRLLIFELRNASAGAVNISWNAVYHGAPTGPPAGTASLTVMWWSPSSAQWVASSSITIP